MNLSIKPNKIFFLGPEGTFTDKARSVFSQYFEIENAEKIPVCSISKGFDLLTKNENSSLILPIENSVEGMVRETTDNLIALENQNIKIIAEHIISVEQNLIGFCKNISEIKKIISHPQAIAQCRKYLFNNFPDAELQYSSSTASAISSLTPKHPEICAIGSSYCAQIYNVPVIEENINDKKNNQTRFIMIGTQTVQKQPNSKTAITFTTSNTPGALNRILSIFEHYNINMTQIESRPSKTCLGDYTFLIEIDGHFQDDMILKALFEAIKNTKTFKHLGSYFSI
ncbi:prephenate dehydratase [bacterium]|nr:prephenate dehydratase [bacterium]